MAQTLGTGDKKSVNVELNIIPFIDLMSCLTCFLLITAVWVNIAQLEIAPAGRSREAPDCIGDTCDEPKLSVLINADEIWIGVSRVNDFQKIPRLETGYDWAKLEDSLKQQKASAFFDHKTEIEIAAESTASHPISYQTLIAAMDIAVKTGFTSVGLSDAQSLSARPQL